MNKPNYALPNVTIQNSKSIWAIVTTLITALAISIGLYVWQNASLDSQEQNLEQKIQTLEEEINKLRSSQDNQVIPSRPEDRLPSSEAEETIQSRAEEVMSAIKDQDGLKLASFAHPDLGVRFSPYAYVDTEDDLVFTASQLQNIFSDTTKYVWGAYDGTGDPIVLTFEEYYQKFIYDHDFIDAEEIGYNEIIGQGNTINNNFEIYPASILVEFHFSGFDPVYEGMDWSSLRLAFEQKDSVWYIVGIIHDHWTI